MRTAKLYLTLWVATAAIITITRCSLIDAIPPPDFPVIEQPVDTIPVDTITPPVDSIVNPPCEGYEGIQFPSFITFYLNLDMPLFQDSNFYYQPYPMAPVQIIDPETFFDTVYYSGVNIAGIKSGTNDAAQYNNIADFFVIDGSGTDHSLSFSSQALHFRGAVPCSQLKAIWKKYPSVQLLRFQNSGCTCEEIIGVLETPLEEGCYATPNIVDLRPVSIGTCAIPQNIIDEYALRGSTLWL